jgi:threonylcarbamoyladenosine tRNA methylthiotransferase MtaB
VTFGCRLNTYEAEVMKAEAEKAGPRRARCGIVMFNTCAVTAEAVRQASRLCARLAARTRTRASSSPAARRRPRPAAFERWTEVDLVHRQR